MWRLVLESYSHDNSCFITLTYNDEHLPDGGTLVVDHYQRFLKRLRRLIEPKKIRYFMVGEYGDQSFRPHYHACIFGLGMVDHHIINRAWVQDGEAIGFVHVGEFNQKTAQYCAGYVVKKMTAADDPRLKGRHPEFARMSLRPGIGALGMVELAENLMANPHFAENIEREGDVPTVLQLGKIKFPLGKYLRQKLRDEIGMPDDFNEEVIHLFAEKKKAELREVQEDSAPNTIEHLSPKAAYQKKTKQSILNLETRNEIFSKKGPL